MAMVTTDPRDRMGYDRRLEWLGAWSGIAWVVVCGGGFGASGLLPVMAASTTPEDLVAHLADIKYQILVGMMLVLMGGLTFLMTWSLTFAQQIRKYANPSPLAFYVLAMVGLVGAIIGMMCGAIGSAMAFRVETLSPDTTQLLYDLIWFLFLIPWPPFMLWQFIAGFAILSDANNQNVFPRWLGYFSLWAGCIEGFSALSVFFYSGPFSYNGLVTFWVPGVSFFIWVLVCAIVQVRRSPRASSNVVAGQAGEAPDIQEVVEPVRIPTASGVR